MIGALEHELDEAEYQVPMTNCTPIASYVGRIGEIIKSDEDSSSDDGGVDIEWTSTTMEACWFPVKALYRIEPKEEEETNDDDQSTANANDHDHVTNTVKQS